ncbi:MAG: RAMP superfamily CRISPR-associated protein, partial [Hydrogenothermaceae bacterium]|nr:RAMP superfamily CRISPR-associated protein [Hydrogenothermaceae bacterium]
MNRKSYFFKVVTPLHVGAGQGLSYVDLPIVREVHTQFPFVPGSSIKGAVRDYCLRSLAGKYQIEKVSVLDNALTKNEWNGLNVEEEDKNLLIKVFGTAGEAEGGGSG